MLLEEALSPELAAQLAGELGMTERQELERVELGPAESAQPPTSTVALRAATIWQTRCLVMRQAAATSSMGRSS